MGGYAVSDRAASNIDMTAARAAEMLRSRWLKVCSEPICPLRCTLNVGRLRSLASHPIADDDAHRQSPTSIGHVTPVSSFTSALIRMVARGGIAPPTRGSSVHDSRRTKSRK